MVGWHHRLNGHEFEQALGRWWRTGRPGVLQSMGLQRVRHDWAAEQPQIINTRNKKELRKAEMPPFWASFLLCSLQVRIRTESCPRRAGGRYHTFPRTAVGPLFGDRRVFSSSWAARALWDVRLSFMISLSSSFQALESLTDELPRIRLGFELVGTVTSRSQRFLCLREVAERSFGVCMCVWFKIESNG